MRKVIYSFAVSLDGFVNDRDGNFGSLAPDEEVHRFHNEQTRGMGAHLYGRRLWEVMSYWETAEQNPSATPHELEFARLWKETPKLVFSRTLTEVEGHATLVRGDLAEEVAKLKEQPGGDMSVGGPRLASSFIELGLVDEYGVFIYPVVLGGGTSYFPPSDGRIDLQLVETRTFDSGVIYARYLTER